MNFISIEVYQILLETKLLKPLILYFHLYNIFKGVVTFEIYSVSVKGKFLKPNEKQESETYRKNLA